MKVTLPDVQQSITDESFKLPTSWFTFFQDVWRAIRGSLDISIGGTISVNTTSIPNAGSGETDLITYSMAANMRNGGDELYLKAWGVYAANANNKTIRLKFGSQTILDTGAISANSGSWQIEASILRTGAATQEIIASFISGSTTTLTTRTIGTQDLTISNDLIVTGQGTSSSDIVQNSMLVKLTPNN